MNKEIKTKIDNLQCELDKIKAELNSDNDYIEKDTSLGLLQSLLLGLFPVLLGLFLGLYMCLVVLLLSL